MKTHAFLLVVLIVLGLASGQTDSVDVAEFDPTPIVLGLERGSLKKGALMAAVPETRPVFFKRYDDGESFYEYRLYQNQSMIVALYSKDNRLASARVMFLALRKEVVYFHDAEVLEKYYQLARPRS